MARYLAMRIEDGKLDYLAVVTRYPQYKEAIDNKLIADGYEDLIVNTEEKSTYVEIAEEKITINNEYISIAA